MNENSQKEKQPVSHRILQGPERAGARAMYKAAGFGDEDLRQPIIGIANTWTEVMPCNFHLRLLAEEVKKGIREAGGTPIVTGHQVTNEFVDCVFPQDGP